MNLILKIMTYILLISTFDNNLTTLSEVHQHGIDGARNRALLKANGNSLVKLLKLVRVRRQDPVVQPDWTADQDIGPLFQDFDVKVTDKKLEETEVIRELIQETVDEDTYVVELNESDFKEDNSGPEAEGEVVAPETEPEPELQRQPEPELKPEVAPAALKPKSALPAKSSKKIKKASKSKLLSSSPFSWFKKLKLFNLWRKQ